MDYREIFKRVTAELRAERKKRQLYQERVTELEAQLQEIRAQAGPALNAALQEIERVEKKIDASF